MSSLLETGTVLLISRQISKKLGKKLNDIDYMNIVEKLRTIKLNDFGHHTIDEIVEKVSSMLIQSEPDKNINMHQWLNNELIEKDNDRYTFNSGVKFLTEVETDMNKSINTNKSITKPNSKDITSIYGVNDLHYLQRLINPSSQYKKAYILLDTDNAESFSQYTIFRWNFMPNSQIASETVNVVGNIRDLVGMRIFPVKTSFLSQPSSVLAENTTAITTVYAPGFFNLNGNSEYSNDYINQNHNFTILIDEFSSQSYVGREGRKFHFVLFPFLLNPGSTVHQNYYTPLDPYYELTTSGKGNGWFWFKTPITSFSTLTISIANPFTVLPLNNTTTRVLIPIELIYLNDSNGNE
jgi:hypothetical protein